MMNILRYLTIVVLLFSSHAPMAVETIAGQSEKSRTLPHKFQHIKKHVAKKTKKTKKAKKNHKAQYKTIKLSPAIRTEVISNDKYTVDVADILPHLKNIMVFTAKEQFEKLPFVTKNENNNLMGDAGAQCFVHGAQEISNGIYSILREKKGYIHPETGESLGVEFVVVGDAKLAEKGTDFTIMDIIKSNGSIDPGDKLLPRIDLSLPAVINGVAPNIAMTGYILDTEEGLWDMGKFHNVVISLGARDGVESGHVLNILRTRARDNLFVADKGKLKKPRKQTTDQGFAKYGELLVYKVFEKMSLGIILDAKHPITILDVVKSDGCAA